MKYLSYIVVLLSFIAASCKSLSAVSDTTYYTMTATYYADKFVGRKTSSGEVFTQDKMTCAHKTIALGTYVEVVNPKGGQRVILKVNDRCPKVGILDMTRTAMTQLGIKGKGTVMVRVIGDKADDYVAVPDGAIVVNPEPAAPEVSKPTTPKATKKAGNAKRSTKPAEAKRDSDASTPDSAAEARRPRLKSHNPRIHRGGTGALFDLHLSTERSMKKAEARASLLPSQYADMVDYVPVAHGYKVILRTAMTIEDLQAIIDELLPSFPRLATIKAE